MFSQSDKIVKVEIISDWDGISNEFNLGVKFSISPGWYIYWRNPGDAGLAPEIKFEIPSHFAVDEPKFPLPEKIIHGDIVSYGYHEEVVLLIPVRITSKEKLRNKNMIKARINWLACSESCIPGSATIEYKVSKASPNDIALIERYKRRMPKKFELSGLEVKDFKVEKKGNLNLIKVKFAGRNLKQLVDFYPDIVDGFLIDYKSVKVKNGSIELTAMPMNPANVMNLLSGVIVLSNEGYEFKLNLTKTK
jgi:thiol:disulfide interchange protein DsbD